MRTQRKVLAAIAVVALLGAGGCSNNQQGDDASPSYLTVNFQLLPLEQNVGCACYLQFSTTNLRNELKVPGQASDMLDVRLDEYVVEWRRIDGGTVASPTERFGGNVLIPIGGIATLNDYEFMGPDSLLLPPLNQLLPFNGGFDRETGKTTIRQEGKVTFRGHNMAGQPVSGYGVFGMNFAYRGGRPAPVPDAASTRALPSLALRPLTGGR